MTTVLKHMHSSARRVSRQEMASDTMVRTRYGEKGDLETNVSSYPYMLSKTKCCEAKSFHISKKKNPM